MSDLRVLVFGGSGMLGHKLIQQLPAFGYHVWATVRNDPGRLLRTGLADPEKVIGGIDVRSGDSIRRALDQSDPDAVINAVGVIKQKEAVRHAVETIEVNSVFPQRLYEICFGRGIRVVTISTDCVFSGVAGAYREDDPRDAEDLYGRSKSLGEISAEGAVTLRTSIIGRELSGAHGLLEWFLSEAGGAVRGFSRAVFSGLTTLELARVIGTRVLPDSDLGGLYHVSSEAIAKDRLLGLINDSFGTGTEIVPDDALVIDRSLNSDRFRTATDYSPPSWEEMIEEAANDPSPYEEWRKLNT